MKRRKALTGLSSPLLKNPHNVFGNGNRQDGKRDGKSCLFENDDHTENGSIAARIKSPEIEG
jgi:hypothetical protein